MNAKTTRRTAKRLLAALMALALSVMLVPAAAFAEGGSHEAPADTNECVQAGADNDVARTEVGNVSVTDGNHGIDADALNSGASTVRAGDVNSTEGNGVNADAGSGGTVTVNAGDVTSGRYNGVQARADEGGTVTVTTGTISSGEDGTGIWTSAKNSTEDASSSVTVKAGDVRAEGEGVVMRPDAGSSITVEAGDVKAGGDGVQIVTENGGEVHLTATNITAGNAGLLISADDDATIDVLVTGTLSGGKTPILLYGTAPKDPGNFKITVWKVDFDGTDMTEEERAAILALMTAAAADVRPDREERWNPYDGLTSLNSILDQSISYIMKLSQSEGATLSATDENGTPLGTEHGYSVAKAGDRVMLKVDLEEGCELVAAYDGSGNKVDLVQAPDGSYYIAYTVPAGGGLGLSVEVTKPLAGQTVEAVEKALAENSALARAIAAQAGAPLAKTGDALPVTAIALLALASALALALAGRARVLNRTGASATRR